MSYYHKLRKIQLYGCLNQSFKDVTLQVSFDETSLRHYLSGDVLCQNGQMYICGTYIPISVSACESLIKRHFLTHYGQFVEFYIEINSNGGCRFACRQADNSGNFWLDKILGPLNGETLRWSSWYN